jgi:hypothetical protein
MAVRTLYDEVGNPVVVDLDDDQADAPAASEGQPSNDAFAKQRQALTAARREADQYKREAAFARIGLDLDDPKVSDFVKAYDGELTVEKIKEAATTRGYLQAPAAAEEGGAPESGASPVDTAAVDASARMSSAAAGAEPDLRSDTAKMVDAYAQGGSAALQDHLRSLGFQVVVEGQQ